MLTEKCDQIGRFLKVFDKKIAVKVAQIFGYFLLFLKKPLYK